MAQKDRRRGTFRESFWEYPSQLDSLISWIRKHYNAGDLFFCPQLLDSNKRTKGTVVTTPNAWADLDTAHPDILKPAPSITLETSDGRYQAFWVLKGEVDPVDAETISRKIAWSYKDDGVDTSGWDLTQLLRVPFTYNFKYEPRQVVKVHSSSDRTYGIDAFSHLEDKAIKTLTTKEPMPDLASSPSSTDMFESYKPKLPDDAIELYLLKPDFEKRSFNLWKLECLLAEAGVPKRDAFVIAKGAACNKFEEDNRPDEHLWDDIVRAFASVFPQEIAERPTGEVQSILTEDEQVEAGISPDGFFERYLEWAGSVSDAAKTYHEAGALLLLSALFCGKTSLRTGFGNIIPNLWFLILADTTLTRKTTAMDMAMEIIEEVDEDAVLATDGTIEGIFSALMERPNRTSIFWRDEVTGLIESASKKDYQAGILEGFTKLYDGKMQKRILRKETIEVRDPRFIFFAGGIRTRFLEIISEQHIYSGFLPRFLIFTAESEVDKLRPLGPPAEIADSRRLQLISNLLDMHDNYSETFTIEAGGTVIENRPIIYEAKLSSEAWDAYNRFERKMLDIGVGDAHKEAMTPVMDRMAKSGLKMAMLFASSQRAPDEDNTFVVSRQDVVKAFSLIDRWIPANMEVIRHAGRSRFEAMIDSIQTFVTKLGSATRAEIMERFRLNSRDMELVDQTIIQRRKLSKTSAKGVDTYAPL